MIDFMLVAGRHRYGYYYSSMFRSLLLLAAFVAVAAGPLLNLSHYWNHNPLYGFGWFALVLAALLAVQRLDRLPRHRPDNNRLLAPLIVLILLTWVPLRIVQVGNPDWRVLDTLFMLGTAIVLLLMIERFFGRRWVKILAFPVLFMLVGLPWPVKIENAVTLHSLLSVGQTAQTLLGWPGTKSTPPATKSRPLMEFPIWPRRAAGSAPFTWPWSGGSFWGRSCGCRSSAVFSCWQPVF